MSLLTPTYGSRHLSLFVPCKSFINALNLILFADFVLRLVGGGKVHTEQGKLSGCALFTLHVVSCWGTGLSDAWFISNGSLRFSGLSDAGRGAVTLGRAGVLEDTALGPLLIMDAIDLFD